MSIIGSAIGGALGIGASIFGGHKASEAMRNVKRNLERSRQENRSWYDRRYNEDATQRADAQRILTITNDNIRQRNQAAAGAQAVMGGTEEGVAAEKAANNQALAEATSQIAAAGDRRKDAVEETYRATEADYDRQLNKMEMNRANEIAQAAKGVMKVGAGMGDMF